ncbi:PfkB family carbohydrate kinase [Enemella sp. A6]|uniref:PfkB family carbohydrate kinase n=1 Tax=Enemella sp. A6 TaxID=3440152 RepID=UPI003EBC680E
MRRGVFVGLATLDVIHRVSHRPGADEKVTASWQGWAAGGPATNAAVTHAALGGEATLVTALGRGHLARLVAAELADHGVRVVDATPDLDLDLAVSAITVQEGTGERAVVSRDAAAHRAAVPDGLAELLDGADTLLLDGHHPDLAVGAAELARRAEVEVTIDAGRWKPVFANLMPLADVAICSTGFRFPDHPEAADTAAHGLQLGLRMVAITHGAGPVRWWRTDDSGEVPVPEVTAVDTLGAGDALHGAWCYAEGSDPERLAFGVEVAAKRVTRVGPREWLTLLG